MQTWLAARLHSAGGCVRKVNNLKSNQLQSAKGRGIAGLSPKTQTQSHIQRKTRIHLHCSTNVMWLQQISKVMHLHKITKHTFINNWEY